MKTMANISGPSSRFQFSVIKSIKVIYPLFGKNDYPPIKPEQTDRKIIILVI